MENTVKGEMEVIYRQTQLSTAVIRYVQEYKMLNGQWSSYSEYTAISILY